ncbi:hypothetical protein E3P78_03248 [Wallemia ichthyophaga]|nr:hypothetical protein E3P78_03248 [Wallemia ichthyophaga]
MTEIEDEDILAIPNNMETLSLPSSPKSNEPFFGYNSLLNSVSNPNSKSSPTKSHLSASVEPFNPSQRGDFSGSSSGNGNGSTPTVDLKSSPESDAHDTQSSFNPLFMPPPPLPLNMHRTNSFNHSQSQIHSHSTNADDISTIFVVGFPDDMTDREFQNMFIFSAEFEAATLKIPAKDVVPPPHKDPYSLAHIPSTSIMSERENAPGSAVDESANLHTNNMHMHANMNMNLNMNVTAAQQLSARKQTIGFAKFRSKPAALEAKDILSGRKIDSERGCVLKAEMAKKNLHTRSKKEENNMQATHSTQEGVGLGVGAGVGLGVGVGVGARDGFREGTRVNPPTSTSLNSQTSNSSLFGPSNSAWDGPRSSAVFEAFHNATSSPTTGSICSPNQETLFRPFDTEPTPPSGGFDPFQSNKYTLSPSGQTGQSGQLRQSRNHEKSNSSTLSPLNSLDAYSPPMYTNGGVTGGVSVSGNVSGNGSVSGNGNGNGSHMRPLSPRTLDPNSNSALASQSLGRRLSALALGHNLGGGHVSHSAQDLNSSNTTTSHIGLALNDVQVTKTSPPPAQSSSLQAGSLQTSSIHTLHSQLAQTGAQTGVQTSAQANAQTNTQTNAHTNTHTHTLTPTSTQSQTSNTAPSLAPLKPTNPADQNPPCSTLYVGNLTTPPPSQPVSLLEDALRALFSKQGGFKRLSFRQKANGPMCFVEFEDVHVATKTLHELYGNTLNGLIRGGIRLSYSKNPLGVRSNMAGGGSTGNTGNSNHSSNSGNSSNSNNANTLNTLNTLQTHTHLHQSTR